MSNVLAMPVDQTPEEADRLFHEYVAAVKRAEETRNVSDGIAAGHAWRRFLYSFAPVPYLADVVRMDDRRRP